MSLAILNVYCVYILHNYAMLLAPKAAERRAIACLFREVRHFLHSSFFN